MFSQHQDEAFRENTMTAKEKTTIPLPKGWTGHVRSAALHVIGLAQYATVYTCAYRKLHPRFYCRVFAV